MRYARTENRRRYACRMPVPTTRPPLSRVARLALILSLVALLGNFVFNGVAGAVAATGATTFGLGIGQLVVISLLAIAAIVCGVRGMRETGTGAARGRGLAIAGLVIGIIVLVGQLGFTLLGLLIPA